jgi:hypothetical protein
MYLGTDWWPYVAIPIVLFFWKHRKQLQFNQTKDPAKDTKIDGYKKNAIAMSKSWVKIVWMIKFYGYYLVTCLLNNKISFYHGYMHDFVTNSEGVRKSFILDRYFAIGLFGVGLTFWSIPEALRTPYGAAWGLVWFLVNVVIWTNLITFQQHISLRYVYLANVGLMLWLAHMLSFATWLLPAVIAWYICRNWFNQNAYKNDWWNTEYNIIQEPNYFYPWLLRGNTHFTRGMWMTAFYDYVEAKNFDPRNFKVHYNIISCMIAMNKLEEARQLTEVLHEIEVFGQEEIKAGLIKERLALISQIEIAKIRKEKLNLTVEDIGFLV